MRVAIGGERQRYLLSGAISALLNNVILIAGDRAGLGNVALVGLCFLITGTVAYFIHCRFTFRRGERWGSYLAFMSGIALGVPVALLLLAVLRSLLGLPMSISAPSVTVLMILYNYLAARLAITRRLFSTTPIETVREA